MKSSIVKELLLCLLSAAFLLLSFLRYNLWLFAWFGFVPLFFALENRSKARVLLLSFFTGIIFWLGTIYWLIHVTLSGTILLILYLSLYFSLFGFIITIYRLPITDYRLFFIPCVWVILEYIRSHLFSGFPWALLGYSQYQNLPIIQIADITGVWGVSFLVMMVNVAIYKIKSKKYLLPVLCILVILSYGYYKRYDSRATIHEPRIRISVIQPNIPQELKWDSERRDWIMERYFNLTMQAAKDRPDLIVWPEAALPSVINDSSFYYEKTVDFVKGMNIPLLLGAVTLEDNNYYNNALLISKEGELLAKYDKLHLVPFGEYMPLRNIFRFLEDIVPIGDFTPGEEYTIFRLKANFAVLICFEDVVPELAQRFAKRGADFLVNITNDAWFGRTSSPYQHLQASVFRAVENRLPVVRAANTGVSGFITADGRIISLSSDSNGQDIFVDGYKTEEINIPKKLLSFYSRFGDLFILACILFVLYGIIHSLKSRRKA